MSRFSCYGDVDPGNPEAAGICDRGGEVRKRHELKPEMEWRGNRLVANGFLVCLHHMDKPQPQDRPRILPADPVPVRNPRPDLDFVQAGATGAGILEGVAIIDGTQAAHPTETEELYVSVSDTVPNTDNLPPDGSSWFAP